MATSPELINSSIPCYCGSPKENLHFGICDFLNTIRPRSTSGGSSSETPNRIFNVVQKLLLSKEYQEFATEYLLARATFGSIHIKSVEHSGSTSRGTSLATSKDVDCRVTFVVEPTEIVEDWFGFIDQILLPLVRDRLLWSLFCEFTGMNATELSDHVKRLQSEDTAGFNILQMAPKLAVLVLGV